MILGFIAPIADPVMTTTIGASLTRNQVMIKYYLQPVRGVMAGIARLTGHNMSRAFAGGNGAVVAGLASIGGLLMDKRYDDRQPGFRGMTGLAQIRS
jgi:hypothetical protein